MIAKARRYIHDPSEAPQGVEPEQGERGGWYYETSSQDLADELAGRPQRAASKFEQIPLRAMAPDQFGARDLAKVNEALIDGLPDPPGQSSWQQLERSPTAYGDSGQQIQDGVEEQRARRLADRMQLPIPEPDDFSLEMADTMAEMAAKDGRPFDRETYLRERMEKKRWRDIDSLLGAWTWSASENPQGRVIQRAIQEEFGLDDAAQPWRGMRPEEIYGKREQQEAKYRELDEKTEEEWSRSGEMSRKLVRAMYDETQEFFQKHGITEVPVMRGMGLADNEGRAPTLAPDYADDLGVDAEIDLIPGSCFTTNFDVAATFSGTVDHGATVFARVPANRVLSTFRTGFGQMKEAEIVVLGGRLEGVVIPSGGRVQVMQGEHHTRDTSNARRWAKWTGMDPADMDRAVPKR